MLKSSFQHLERIGAHRERELWRQGVMTWDALERQRGRQLFLFGNDYARQLADSRRSLKEGNVEYFARRLARREHYRIAFAFPSDTIFLDIETTGLSLYYDHITLIGWSRQGKYGVFIKGQEDSAFRRALAEAKVVVTFNGSLFDLPFIRKEFPSVKLPVVHIDLRFLAKRAGFSGGQKALERRIGIVRNQLEGIDGSTAVVLWHEYSRGSRESLATLIRYNHADIEGMKPILDESVARLLESTEVPKAIWPETRFAKDRSRLRLNDQGRRARSIHIPAFQGRSGPRITCEELGTRELLSDLTVVGIDLTGSERRASGWCELAKRNASTEMLHTDDELIERTIGSKPHVVSIDSPLSLPFGRCHISDDDPGRARYGIMRQCERTLRRRGINVYPCLIPSMQRLTERGMRMASVLRKAGLPVIESYPGAAQDILGIPRKRVSTELLSTGLQEFGISGPWTESKPSHDELDALTSAIVGVFWWCGRFEALSGPDEGALIVPDLGTTSTSRLEMRVVGISGPMEAGKTTASRFLADMGYRYGRFSSVLARLLGERGIVATRHSLQDIGQEVHISPGQRWLCDQLISELDSNRIVIDGMRHPEDHSTLVEHFGASFTHIFVSAPESRREERYKRHGEVAYDFATASKHPVERNIEWMGQLAHRTVINRASMRQFREKVLESVSAVFDR